MDRGVSNVALVTALLLSSEEGLTPTLLYKTKKLKPASKWFLALF